ncbi:hypothetical protein D9757_002941 [Collybiopsis confluens]|uniref:Uncharacterized protein n=1 Tax=Collybiopsis confluens TaxID=2823264 RepID=A0A8H5HVN2_9AGAR|nr:hypothetical protein D9757_002941 [Collybiopsis confluens]
MEVVTSTQTDTVEIDCADGLSDSRTANDAVATEGNVRPVGDYLDPKAIFNVHDKASINNKRRAGVDYGSDVKKKAHLENGLGNVHFDEIGDTAV